MKWTFVISIIHFSFIKEVTYQNKTAVCFANNSIKTFVTNLISRREQYWECKSEISRRPLFWSMIVHNCWKIMLRIKVFGPFFFVLEAEWTTFPRPFPTFVVLRWEHFLMNRMRFCRKTQVSAKSWNRFGWDFYSFVFRCKHHLLNSFRSVVVNFCENRFLNEGWLSEDFILLLEILFSSSLCFVHQMFTW